MCPVAQVAEPKFAAEGHVFLQPLFVLEFFFSLLLSLFEFFADFLEEVGYGLRLHGTIPADEAKPRLLIYFYVGYTCPILPPVVLLLHQDIHLVHRIRRAVLFNIIREGFAQAHQGNSAFMKESIGHGSVRLALGYIHPTGLACEIV